MNQPTTTSLLDKDDSDRTSTQGPTMTPSTNNGSAEQQLAPPSLDRRESSGLAGTPHEGAPGPTDGMCKEEEEEAERSSLSITVSQRLAASC